MSARSPDPIDFLVGHNIRIHRCDKGLTQTDLAKRIGVTFQQVQKYEEGRNRVGGSRLFKIADALELPLNTFFEGCNISHQRVEDSPLLLLALLAEPHAVRILKAFCQIDDMETRSALVDVVERLVVQR